MNSIIAYLSILTIGMLAVDDVVSETQNVTNLLPSSNLAHQTNLFKLDWIQGLDSSWSVRKLFKRQAHDQTLDLKQDKSDELNEESNNEICEQWSTCSATCDYGLQTQRCQFNNTNTFSMVKYRVCQAKAKCDELNLSIRSKQCAYFNRIPYRNVYYHWKDHVKLQDPCALYCDGYEVANSNNSSKLVLKSVKLQDWVLDGSSCSLHTNSMCINSKCMSIDCELNLGGKRQLDACGICGGDNSTCLNSSSPSTTYQLKWIYSNYDECLPKCNQVDNKQIEDEFLDEFTNGFQVSNAHCVNETLSADGLVEQQIVSDDHCDLNVKPKSRIKSCKNYIYLCKPQWISLQWSNCSTNCGTGTQIRDIFCAYVSKKTKSNDKPKQIFKTENHQCSGQTKPKTHQKCQNYSCPKWFESAWSDCSVACGQGSQNRLITCRDQEGNLSEDCNLDLKPIQQQACYIDCNEEYNLQEDQADNLIVSDRATGANIEPNEEPNYIVGKWSECSKPCGHGHRTRSVECKILFKFSGSVATLPDSECHGLIKPKHNEKCFVKVCENYKLDESFLFMNLSSIKSDKFLNDFKLNQKQQNLFEQQEASENLLSKSEYINNKFKSNSKFNLKNNANNQILGEVNENDQFSSEQSSLLLVPSFGSTLLSKPAANDELDQDLVQQYNLLENEYYWQNVGYTECSAACLGGTQDSIIKCFFRFNKTEAPSHLCDLRTKPDYLTRTCNDRPCPPKWNVSEYSACSKTCGKGEQVREVNCIHEVTRGVENVIRIPNNKCSSPMPSTKQFCNIKDCESEWQVSEWSECHHKCGRKGFRVRKVKCTRIIAFGDIVELDDSKCNNKTKPNPKEICIKEPCTPVQKKSKFFHTSKGVLVQKNRKISKLALKAHGEAIIYAGTSIKIKCPVKNEDLNQTIDWFKNGQLVDFKRFYLKQPHQARMKVKCHLNAKKALCLNKVDPSDSGVYLCTIRKNSTNLTDFVKISSIKLLIKSKQVKSQTNQTIYAIRRTHINPNEFDQTFNSNWNKLKENISKAKNTKFIDSKMQNNEIWPNQNQTKPSYGKEINYKIDYVLDQNLASTSSSFVYDVFNNTKKLVNKSKLQENNRKSNQRNNILKVKSKQANFLNKNQQFSILSRNNAVSTLTTVNPVTSQLLELLTKLLIRKSPSQTALNEQDFKTGKLGDLDLFEQSSEKENLDENDENEIPIDDIEDEQLSNNIVQEMLLTETGIKSLVFDWILSEWSLCSVTCGIGFQVRGIQCMVKLYNTTKAINDALCLNAGLRKPSSIRRCGHNKDNLNCKLEWKVEEWTPCNCSNENTGIQTRVVQCVQGGKPVNNRLCDKLTKPEHRLQCSNDRCNPTTISSLLNQ